MKKPARRKPRASRSKAQKSTHLEGKTVVIHRSSAWVSATESHNRIGLGYFIDATLTERGATAPTLLVELQVRNDRSALPPWGGIVELRARDAWVYLRALELAFEGAAAAGLIPTERLVAPTSK